MATPLRAAHRRRRRRRRAVTPANSTVLHLVAGFSAMPVQELQLLDLPDELLVEVLSHLDEVERCGCARGCTCHPHCGAAAMPHVAHS